MEKYRAYSLAVAADDAWYKELTRLFGRKRAADMRHAKAGRGDIGSNLRYLYDNRAAAFEHWRAIISPCDAQGSHTYTHA